MILLHWKVVLLAFLKPLGFWGIGVLGALDAGLLAIPMDLIVAGYVWNDRSRFWLYAIMAALGAAVGALVPWYIGRAGGEHILLKRVDRNKFDQLKHRFARHGFLAVAIPAAMPPPFPFKLFAFGAGIFEMNALPYMGAVFTGRAVHYLVVAALVMRFGPEIVSGFLVAATGHSIVIGAIVVALLGLYVIYRVRKRRAGRAFD